MTLVDLRDTLQEAGFEFVIKSIDGCVATVHVLIKEDKDVHS